MARKQFDYMKHLPVVVVAVSLIGSYFTLKNDIGNAQDKIKEIEEKKITSIEIVQTQLTANVNDIKLAQVEQKGDLKSITALLMDIKDRIKK